MPDQNVKKTRFYLYSKDIEWLGNTRITPKHRKEGIDLTPGEADFYVAQGVMGTVPPGESEHVDRMAKMALGGLARQKGSVEDGQEGTQTAQDGDSGDRGGEVSTGSEMPASERRAAQSADPNAEAVSRRVTRRG